MCTPEVSRERLVRNTVANGVGSVVVALLAIALTPFFLRRLGPAEYGVWLLALTLTFGSGYLGLADLGLQQAAVRLIASARGRGDADGVNRIVSTMASLFVVVGVALGTALALAAGLVSSVFALPPELSESARTVFALVGVQIALDLPGASLLAVIEGAQRYAALRLIDVGVRVAWAAGSVAAVLAGHGVVALAAVSLVAAAGGLVVTLVVSRRVEPSLRVAPRLATRSTLSSILRQGSALLVLRVTSVVYRQMDRAILGVLIGTTAVARYEVAYKIHATAAIVLSIAPSAVMPAAAWLGAADDRERLRSLYLRATKYAVAMCVPVAVAAMVYAKALIATWVGDAYISLAGVTRLFLLYPLLVVVHVIGVTMLIGLGRMRAMTVLSPASVAVNLLLSVLLASRYGITGVVVGTLLGYAAVWVPYLVIMLREFDVPPSRWFRAVVVPNLAPTATQVGFGLATLRLAERSGQLWQVAGLAGASVAVSLAVFLARLDAGERLALVRSFRRVPSAEIT